MYSAIAIHLSPGTVEDSYNYWEWIDRREGWLVIEGHVGQQILQVDSRSSSTCQIPRHHPLIISRRTVARIAPSFDSGLKKIIFCYFGMEQSPRNTILTLGRSDVPSGK